MGTKYKAVIYFDSNDMGAVNRLLEEGIISSMTCKRVEEEDHDARKFVHDVRAAKTHSFAPRRERTPGLTAPSCVIAIMQEKPGEVWSRDDIATILEADYELNKHTASPALSILKQHGFVQRVSMANYVLTESGRSHKQADPVPGWKANGA